MQARRPVSCSAAAKWETFEHHDSALFLFRPLPLHAALTPLEAAAILALALAASALSFFSGFGLGTVLLPAFALALPIEAAVAATAVVHWTNNAWKSWLVRQSTAWDIVLRFGIPALVAALVGAGLLLVLPSGPLWSYDLGGERSVTWTGLVVGLLITGFAAFDLVPALRSLEVGRRYLVPGGAASGFFGGLSGHQGALRSSFLSKLGMTPRAFIATGAACALLVDTSRLAVYGVGYGNGLVQLGTMDLAVLALAVAMASLGTILASRWVAKTTVSGLRILVGVLLLIVGPAIAAGLV